MKLAFCLFKFFPYGGLQRDFLHIARVCRQRGHEVHVFTMGWEGETEPGFHIHQLDVDGWQNHTRARSFASKVKARLAAEKFDLVVGFNKMPHLDLYYAADVCYQARVREQRGMLYRWSPRYRQLAAFERAVFASGNRTTIMLISPLQQPEFVRFYRTEAERFYLLPPGIARDRMAPANAADIREATRAAWQIKPEEKLLLMVGSGFKTKGLDRAIHALASLPAELKKDCRLFVIGQDNQEPFQKLATQLQVEDNLRFLGGRPDVPAFLLAADVLLHPAYHENTGTVLLEAMIAGLPVLTVDICGYAHYVAEVDCGIVLSSPFQQDQMNASLQKMLSSTARRQQWSQNGLIFSQEADIYSLPEKAADRIEFLGRS
jgi:UDP-glucose:(heptosyl)LPS alpha-1,3-glucosyltransferase